MPNKCIVFGCNTAYESCEEKNVSTFSFPSASDDKLDLIEHWKRFVNRDNWAPSQNSVICQKHFEPKFIIYGKQRNRLNWKLNPIPTIHTDKALKRPSTLPTLLYQGRLRSYEFIKRINYLIF